MLRSKYLLADNFFDLGQNQSDKFTHQLLKSQVKTNINQLLNILKNYHYKTYQHSVNVANMSFLISQAAGIPVDAIVTSTIAGLLHDIGKIRVSPYLLSKPSKLTASEWNLIKKHPQFAIKNSGSQFDSDLVQVRFDLISKRQFYIKI